MKDSQRSRVRRLSRANKSYLLTDKSNDTIIPRLGEFEENSYVDFSKSAWELEFVYRGEQMLLKFFLKF